MRNFIKDICVAAIPLDAGSDKIRAEVEQANQFAVSHAAAQRQHLFAAAVLDPYVRFGGKTRLLCAELFQPPQPLII